MENKCSYGVFCSGWITSGLRCEKSHPNDKERVIEPCSAGNLCTNRYLQNGCQRWHPPEKEKAITITRSRPYLTRCKTCHKPPKACMERHSEDYEGTDHIDTYQFPLSERLRRRIRCQGVLETGYQCKTKVDLGTRSDARPYCPRHR